MYQQIKYKEIRVWFPLARADSGQQEYIALIPPGFTLENFMSSEPEFAEYVLIHPHRRHVIDEANFEQLDDGAVLYGIPSAFVSFYITPASAAGEGVFYAEH